MDNHKMVAFSISCLVLLIAFLALFFLQGLGFIFSLLVTVLIAIFISVEILLSRIPSELEQESTANCMRMDGSFSSRRAARELHARSKIRSDLWAVFLAITMIGAGAIGTVHTVILPGKLWADVASSLRFDPSDFKATLKQENLDRQFFQWKRNTSNTSNANIRTQQHLLFTFFPVFALSLVVFVVAAATGVYYAYNKSLQDFRLGLDQRRREYLEVDICRLQA